MSNSFSHLLDGILTTLSNGRAFARASAEWQTADRLLNLHTAVELFASTYDPDNGNVLPGFKDQNDKERGKVNTVIAQLVAERFAILGEGAIGAGLLFGATGVGLAPAVLALGAGFFVGIAAGAVANEFIEALSACGLTLVGQHVDYTKSEVGLTIIGTTASDVITSTTSSDIVTMGLLNDTLYQKGGSDHIDGGFGTDTVDYSLMSGSIHANYAAAEVIHSSGVDVILSIERVVGGGGSDDFSYAGLTSGSGVYITSDGGDGADTFILGTSGAGKLIGDDGIDIVDLASSNASSSNVNLDGIIEVFGGNGYGSFENTGIENVVGSSGSDHIVGNNLDNKLEGLDGDDKIDGGKGNDVLEGGDDNDRLDGGDGNDSMSGGEGRDYLVGGDGSDTLSGGSEKDTLVGGNDSDKLDGGLGADVLVLAISMGLTPGWLRGRRWLMGVRGQII
jgi:Ca2+-binding RTX toxin-like protein